MSPIGIQHNIGFFSEEEKQESTHIEASDPEGLKISNKSPEGKISIMVVVKCSDNVEGPQFKLDGLLCGGLYKEGDGWIFIFLGTDPDSKKNCFTWYRKDNDWVVTGIQYNNKFKTGKDLSITVSSMNRHPRRWE